MTNIMSMILPIGSDHAGFAMKESVITHLKSKGYTIQDVGCYSEERADYPDFGHAVAQLVSSGNPEKGILLCGSGNGIAMSANKHPHVRAALCWNDEIAKLARTHNDANILVLPARYISEEQALKCVDVFLSEKFEGGRHKLRVEKIEL
jgi:ribose 5-phosphate isomerase B